MRMMRLTIFTVRNRGDPEDSGMYIYVKPPGVRNDSSKLTVPPAKCTCHII